MKLLHYLRTHSSWLALVICVLGFLLRVPLLNGSFWLDEAAQALESVRPLSQQLQIAQDFQPPFLHLLTHFASLISIQEWWLRSVGALIPGLLTIYLTYRIGEVLFSKKVAVWASLLLATSSFHIFYSQELRPYSLSALWTTLSWFLLLQASQKKDWSWKEGGLLSLVTAAGLYTTYLYPFVLLSQAVYIGCCDRSLFKKFSLSCLLSGLVFLPWVPSVFEQLKVGQQLRSDLPGWEKVVAVHQLKSLPLTLGKFLFGVLNLDINPVFVGITAILLLVVGIFAWKRGRTFLLSKRVLALATWFIVPLFTAWLISFWIPILQPKRVIYLLPALYLGLAAVITTPLSKKSTSIPSWASPLALAIFLLINLYATGAYYTNSNYQRENWRELHARILRQYSHNSVVVFGFNGVFAPWQWYDTGSYPVITAGSFTDRPQPVSEQLKSAYQYQYVLVFDYLRDLTDPGHTIEAELENLGFSQKDLFSVPEIGFIRVYAKQSAVLSER